MAATVKPIEARSVHQIQSGQVIVDLCSVVKELVENSLDAGASAIEVRFKNNGLDEIEVQDNGDGIAAVNYENLALKHYTSKLSTYDDLSTLQTFGFRGEALSSLCALSTFTVITAQADEAPKGHKLDFEISGKLKSTSIIACQKGTTASVQNLFEKLPVRRKELSKNIKREYGKVLGLLHAYACISTNVKFIVKNAMPKAKSMTIFTTKSNATTRENIANVYGAKTLSALVALDLELDFEQTRSQVSRDNSNLKNVTVQGHISKPVFGEGRQTPDRQMFFVNGRPCGLPQIAKAINEVYKSFNVSQSPFIFANFQMDTGAYDVNVSPDKRTILLHDATVLTDRLKTALTELFDQQEQTVPHSEIKSGKLSVFKPLTIQRESSTTSSRGSASADVLGIYNSPAVKDNLNEESDDSGSLEPSKLLHDHFRNLTSTRDDIGGSKMGDQTTNAGKGKERRASKLAKYLAEHEKLTNDVDEGDDVHEHRSSDDPNTENEDQNQVAEDIQVRDFNARLKEQQIRKHPHDDDDKVEASEATDQLQPDFPATVVHHTEQLGVVPNAFDRMRPKRVQPDITTITIGDRTVTRFIGSQPSSLLHNKTDANVSSTPPKPLSYTSQKFVHGLQRFKVDGEQSTQMDAGDSSSDNEVEVSVGKRRTGEKDVYGSSELENHQRDLDSASQSPELSPTSNNITGDVHQGGRDDENDDDEEQARRAEERRVEQLIQLAEGSNSEQSSKGGKRAGQALKGTKPKDSVASLLVEIEFDITTLSTANEAYQRLLHLSRGEDQYGGSQADDLADTAEEQLSLTVSKSDFANMHIVGQFNLGFIIAVRPKRSEDVTGQRDHDELFIIDQHASDEKYNFERLQQETIVGNQRMVRPAILDLTAVEEEIVIDNTRALEKNGFIVDIDTSGEQEVGRRCRLTSLPLSKEVIFGTKDLDELIHLLAESPMLNESSFVPRPSKVRKMFAMRACRSSIMIGKTLSRKQMSKVVQHMGTIDKPWNCPHGRPTMRHLASLDKLEPDLWMEGDGVYPGGSSRSPGLKSAASAWKTYASM